MYDQIEDFLLKVHENSYAIYDNDQMLLEYFDKACNLLSRVMFNQNMLNNKSNLD